MSAIDNAVHYQPMDKSSYHLVKVYRLKSGMSKVRLAKLSHLTPRIIHMIEQDPDYNPSRRTMIQLSNALGVPPSVLFFPEEEMEKRQMLSNLVLFCLESLQTDEQTILKKMQDMALSIRPALPPLVAGSLGLPSAGETHVVCEEQSGPHLDLFRTMAEHTIESDSAKHP